jgi:hypothetical protein
MFFLQKIDEIPDRLDSFWSFLRHLSSGDYGAMKVGGHELRGGIAYFNAFFEQVELVDNFIALRLTKAFMKT